MIDHRSTGCSERVFLNKQLAGLITASQRCAPQGPALGPLLFILDIGNTEQNASNVEFHLYADHTAISCVFNPHLSVSKAVYSHLGILTDEFFSFNTCSAAGKKIKTKIGIFFLAVSPEKSEVN